MQRFKQITTAIFTRETDLLFFFLFLLTSTLSVRKVLYFYPINNFFNEYTGVYIYLSDIFLFLTFFLWLITIVYNNYSHLSTTLIRNVSPLFHCSTWNNGILKLKSCSFALPNLSVPRGTIAVFKKLYKQVIHNYVLFFPLAMGFFSFFSILWVTNQPIAWYRSLKLLEFILLFYYVYLRIVPRGTSMPHVKNDYFKILNSNIVPPARNATSLDLSQNDDMHYNNVPRGTLYKYFMADGRGTLSILFHNLRHSILKMFHVEHLQNNLYKCQGFFKSSAHKPSDTVRQTLCSTWNIFFLLVITTSLFQALVAIIQFAHQSSIGLFWLKESIIGPNITGVAKIILHKHVFIRSYGLFPHPNILGSYLIFSILVTLLYGKLFHVEHCNSSVGKLESIVPRGTILKLILCIELFALILTVSKSAVFGLTIGLFYLKLASKQSVPRGTLTKPLAIRLKLFHVEHWKSMLGWGLLAILALLLVKPDFYSLFIKSLQEREFYLNVSRGTFLAHPFLGLGAGQFVVSLLKEAGIQNWQFQPVHNVFLLILNEYGVFLLLGYLYFLFKLFHVEQFQSATLNSERGDMNTLTNERIRVLTLIKIYFRSILLAFIFIMLFDHYFWDIQQGQILLWLTSGLIASTNRQLEI